MLPQAKAPGAPSQSKLAMRSTSTSPLASPSTSSDQACEGCRAYYPYVKQILALHPREARLVMRYVPFHGDVSVEGVRIL